jgi:hypothetical protein
LNATEQNIVAETEITWAVDQPLARLLYRLKSLRHPTGLCEDAGALAKTPSYTDFVGNRLVFGESLINKVHLLPERACRDVSKLINDLEQAICSVRD